MKHIKNGKLVLDGTIRECDLQEKLNKALEIIVDKELDVFALTTYCCILNSSYEHYIEEWDLVARQETNEYAFGHKKPTQEEYELLKEIIG